MGVAAHPRPPEDAAVCQSSNAAPTPTTGLSPEQLQALAPNFAVLGQLADAILAFKSTPPSPPATAAFEQHLAGLTNQLGLNIFAHSLNSIEPAQRDQLPKEIRSHG